MKQQQMDNAKRLYFQTDLSTSEIAEQVGANRRTVYNWIRQQCWDRLRKSTEHLPTLLAENQYLILGKAQRDILSEARAFNPVTPAEAKMLYHLIMGAKKLTRRSTVSEAAEMNMHFLDHVKAKYDPALTTVVAPMVESYLLERSQAYMGDFVGDRLNDLGCIPQQTSEEKAKGERERQLDTEDEIYWAGLRDEIINGWSNEPAAKEPQKDPVSASTPQTTATPLAAQKDETPEEDDVAIDYIAEAARCEADLPEPDSDPRLWTAKQRYARMVSVFAREALRLNMQLRNPPARRD